MAAIAMVLPFHAALGQTVPPADGAKSGKPLKVFILAGQSNMQGHAKISTFDVMALDPKTEPLLKEMRNADGTPRICERVWISSIGSADEEQTGLVTAGFGAAQSGPKIGPEFTFGLTIEKLVDGPVLLIKTAWGGKSLHTDFRSPGAGPFPFRDEQLQAMKDQGKDVAAIQAEKTAATGHYYRLMMEHVKQVLADPKRVCPAYDPAAGYEIAGFIWFQGWNDMVDGGIYPNRDKPGGYDAYSDALTHFIRDVRKELKVPKMPFVIGVMGAGGPVDLYPPENKRYASTHTEFRKAMAAPASLPEFKGTVTAVLTEQYWDQELTKLRAKDAAMQKEIEALVKEGKLEQKDKAATVEKRRTEAFTERELEILTKGASNAEFHYLGSAKILGQIGKAFAEAVHELGKAR
jgi:hypothetical protein